MKPLDDPNKLTLLPSGYFGTSSDLIFIKEDVISKEEIDLLLNLAKTKDIWKESNFRNKFSDPAILKDRYPEAFYLLEEICVRWQKEVSKFYNIEIETYINPICKWPIGGNQKPHADKEWEDGSPGDQNYYDIGSVIYLNDDYEGGEIYFPQHGENGIYLKPKPGMAAAFPGDLFFLHGVNTVQKTERYAIPIFWTALKYEPEKDKTLI